MDVHQFMWIKHDKLKHQMPSGRILTHDGTEVIRKFFSKEVAEVLEMSWVKGAVVGIDNEGKIVHVEMLRKD